MNLYTLALRVFFFFFPFGELITLMPCLENIPPILKYDMISVLEGMTVSRASSFQIWRHIMLE